MRALPLPLPLPLSLPLLRTLPRTLPRSLTLLPFPGAPAFRAAFGDPASRDQRGRQGEREGLRPR
jgi:hypothetical protein